MSESNSPSDEENQESNSTEETNSALESNEKTLTDTEPPPADPGHGWLEQFEAFGLNAFIELEKVAKEGLVAGEVDLLLALALKLVNLAAQHDDNAIDSFEHMLAHSDD